MRVTDKRQARRFTWPLAAGLQLIVLLAACGREPSSLAPTPTPSPSDPATPTAPPAGPLTWTPHVAPVTVPPDANVRPQLAVAQRDGNTAFMCAPTGATSPASISVWVTRDRGANWTPTTPVTVSTGRPLQAANCSLLVDANQSGTAVVRAQALPAGGCVPYVDCVAYVPYVTTDFGEHWKPLAGPLDDPLALATRRGVTYALFATPPRSASFGSFDFAQSTDGMRTWRTVAVPTVATVPSGGPGSEQVRAFWLNPVTGALLVMTSDSYVNDEHFWSSADATHWTQLSAPPFPFAVDDLVVQQPFTGAPWRICGGDNANWSFNGQTNTHLLDVDCTPDGGDHWVKRDLDTSSYVLVAIADDGDLLYTEGATLQRFAIGSGGVEALGSVPSAGTLVYAASGGAGVLWSGPAAGFPNPDAQGRIFTAPYA